MTASYVHPHLVLVRQCGLNLYKAGNMDDMGACTEKEGLYKA